MNHIERAKDNALRLLHAGSGGSAKPNPENRDVRFGEDLSSHARQQHVNESDGRCQVARDQRPAPTQDRS